LHLLHLLEIHLPGTRNSLFYIYQGLVLISLHPPIKDHLQNVLALVVAVVLEVGEPDPDSVPVLELVAVEHAVALKLPVEEPVPDAVADAVLVPLV
jgi:hypothetical protein